MRIFIIIAICSVSFFGYKYINSNPFVGNWRSNKDLTLQKFDEVGLSSKQRLFFEGILGKMTFKITKDRWRSTYDGQESSAYYEILSSSNNCHTVQTVDVDDGETEAQDICIYGKNMYVPGGFFDAAEVFTKY